MMMQCVAVCCSVLQCVAFWKAALFRQVAQHFWHVIYLFLTRDVALLTLTRCTAFLTCSTALSHIMRTALLAHQTALLIRYAALLTRNTALLAHYAALLIRCIALLICCTTFLTYLYDVFEMSRPSAIFRGKSLGISCSSATCRCSVLQCVAVCCRGGGAVCCSVLLQCVAVLWRVLQNSSVLQCVVVGCCCRVLQGVAGCCRVLQGVAGCCRVLQGVRAKTLQSLLIDATPCVHLQRAYKKHTRTHAHTHIYKYLHSTYISLFQHYMHIYLFLTTRELATGGQIRRWIHMFNYSDTFHFKIDLCILAMYVYTPIYFSTPGS